MILYKPKMKKILPLVNAQYVLTRSIIRTAKHVMCINAPVSQLTRLPFQEGDL